jgi:hypothetical protein
MQIKVGNMMRIVRCIERKAEVDQLSTLSETITVYIVIALFPTACQFWLRPQ